MRDRIDSDPESITVIDATPTGDDVLDMVLSELVEEPEAQNPQFWVERIARLADKISDATFERLVDYGILEFDSGGFWSLSNKIARTGRYPLVDGVPGEEIKTRIGRVLLTDEIPDPRDTALIGLLKSCEGVPTLLEPEDLEAAAERIDLLAGMDLIGRSISQAVASSYAPPASLQAAQRRPIPTLGIWEMLKSKTLRKGNFPKFFAETADSLGPVFRFGIGKRSPIVLASAELNRWLGRKGRLHLRARDYLQDFLKEWGAAVSCASLDGPEHYRMRKAYRDGCARRVVETRADEVFDLANRAIHNWKIGDTIVCDDVCQELIGKQMSQLLLGFEPPAGVIHDLLAFEYRALLVHVIGIVPKFMLRTPKMKRCHANVLKLYAQIHLSRTSAQRAGKPRDLADDLMDLHQSDPQFLPETDLGFAFVAALVAGQYSGSAVAFCIYELLANPDIHERIKEEADALFENGYPTAEDLKDDAISVTTRFVMETMRLHPIVVSHVRTVMNAFDFEGMAIPAYSTALVAFTAPHYQSECFEDPEKFDIERFAPPREEHKNIGAYSPYGTGTHMCAGRRWTEFQMVINVLFFVRYLDLEMVPKDYKLKISPFPKLAPARNFKFRVTGHRHPLIPLND